MAKLAQYNDKKINRIAIRFLAMANFDSYLMAFNTSSVR